MNETHDVKSEISEEIIAKAEVIGDVLLTGKSVEIKRNTDGTIKVLEIRKNKI